MGVRGAGGRWVGGNEGMGDAAHLAFPPLPTKAYGSSATWRRCMSERSSPRAKTWIMPSESVTAVGGPVRLPPSQDHSDHAACDKIVIIGVAKEHLVGGQHACGHGARACGALSPRECGSGRLGSPRCR